MSITKLPSLHIALISCVLKFCCECPLSEMHKEVFSATALAIYNKLSYPGAFDIRFLKLFLLSGVTSAASTRGTVFEYIVKKMSACSINLSGMKQVKLFKKCSAERLDMNEPTPSQLKPKRDLFEIMVSATPMCCVMGLFSTTGTSHHVLKTNDT